VNVPMTIPDEALARRILAAVPYKDRFPAGRLRPPVGILPGTVRSLHELHLLLTPDDRSLPGVNLSALADWVEKAVGDGELARKLRTDTANAASYVEGCLKTYELVGARLVQARTAVGGEESS